MAAPFKRGQLLIHTNSKGQKREVKYVKWLGIQRSALVFVKCIGSEHVWCAHVNELTPMDGSAT